MANSDITKKALAETLKKLGLKKDLNKISVSEIVNDCGVNRQTFYYHFSDKYDLLRWIYETEIFDPLMDNLSFDNWEGKMIVALKTIKRMSQFFTNTIRSSNSFFENYLQKTLEKVFVGAIEDLDPNNETSEKEKELYAKFLTFGVSGVIVDWVLNGAKEKEEKLVSDLKKMFIKTEKARLEEVLK